MLRYKINVLSELKNKGFSTYRIRNEKIFGESVLQQLRNNQMVSYKNLDTICTLLQCQPGDILEYTNEE